MRWPALICQAPGEELEKPPSAAVREKKPWRGGWLSSGQGAGSIPIWSFAAEAIRWLKSR
jgi:hypothetical protein